MDWLHLRGIVPRRRLIATPTTTLVTNKKGLSLQEHTGRVRVGEKLVLGFFAYVVVASFIFPLPLGASLGLVGLNLVAGAAILLLSKAASRKRNELLFILRDWFPCVLILLAYRESGLFFVPDPTHRLDYLFERWDSVLLNDPWVLGVLSSCSPWLQRYLEFSYFLCYPIVPLGIGVLYLARRRGELGQNGESRLELATDHFWTAVLLAVLTCYAIFPLFPLTPPRVLFHDVPGPSIQPLLRKMNFWILDRYSVQACIFPSGHVAAVTAVALAVRAYLPRVGIAFIVAALSIAAATVYGRYHYAADAVAGALVGFAASFASSRIHKLQQGVTTRSEPPSRA